VINHTVEIKSGLISQPPPLPPSSEPAAAPPASLSYAARVAGRPGWVTAIGTLSICLGILSLAGNCLLMQLTPPLFMMGKAVQTLSAAPPPAPATTAPAATRPAATKPSAGSSPATRATAASRRQPPAAFNFNYNFSVHSSSTSGSGSNRQFMKALAHSPYFVLALVIDLAGMALAVFLVITGILTLRGLRAGSWLHQTYAWIKIALVLLGGMSIVGMMRGVGLSLFSTADFLPVAATAAVPTGIGLIYPIALLIVLRRPAQREYFGATAR
jgi:hypothetical protein